MDSVEDMKVKYRQKLVNFQKHALGFILMKHNWESGVFHLPKNLSNFSIKD